jgi:hypothetical protein
MEISTISNILGCKTDEARRIAASLVDKGMVIEIAKDKFESLHPRFAATNRYRRLCQEQGIPLKKNLRVDNIGIVLERPYEDARTTVDKP